MPSVLKHAECPTCGHRHHFCLPQDELVPGRTYEYVCPETGRKSMLQPSSGAEKVSSLPQGAVVLTPAVVPMPAKGPSRDSGQERTPPSPIPPSNAQPVDPGTLSEETLARVSAPVYNPPAAQKLHQGESQVQQATGASERQPLAAPSGEPAVSKTCLEEVLPALQDLAVKVGGMERLAQIVNTLRGSYEP
jgi:hypothetical protein